MKDLGIIIDGILTALLIAIIPIAAFSIMCFVKMGWL